MRKIALEETFRFIFSSRRFSSGASFTIASLAIDIYEDDNVTQITAAETSDDDYDSLAGTHECEVAATAANGFERGKVYYAIISAGTVDSVSVVGQVVYEFQIETMAEAAIREFYEKRFPGYVIATTTSNSTTAINLTDIIDAQTPDGDLIGEILSVWDATDGRTFDVIVTALTSLVATVVMAKDGTSAMAITVAAGDRVWRNGHTASNLVRAGNVASAAWSTTRGLAGTALPAAAADAAGGLPISDTGGLDLDAKLANTNEVTAARMGALTDWINGGRLDLIIDAILADTNELQTDLVNGGRLDLLIDAIKAKTDSLTFTVANEVNANTRYIAGAAVQGAGTSGDKWRAA